MSTLLDSDLWDLGEHDLMPLFRTSERLAGKKLRALVKDYFPDVSFQGDWSIDLRDPLIGWDVQGVKVVQNWHQDHNQARREPYKLLLIMWSNEQGTELKRPRGEQVYFCQPNHIYIIDNERWRHRSPKRTGRRENFTRHFIRLVATKPK